MSSCATGAALLFRISSKEGMEGDQPITHGTLSAKLPSAVMVGLVPAIHVFSLTTPEDVDARHKAGHDDADCF